MAMIAVLDSPPELPLLLLVLPLSPPLVYVPSAVPPSALAAPLPSSPSAPLAAVSPAVGSVAFRSYPFSHPVPSPPPSPVSGGSARLSPPSASGAGAPLASAGREESGRANTWALLHETLLTLAIAAVGRAFWCFVVSLSEAVQGELCN